VAASSFRQVPGAHLRIEDLVELTAEISRLIAAGTDGIVITQGTDTIEETTFVLDLLVDTDAPVVVTGRCAILLSQAPTARLTSWPPCK
jgi:L-asparaginase